MSCRPLRNIVAYHGSLPPKVEAVLDYHACPDEDVTDRKQWNYDGSLDELYEILAEVDAMFYVHPKTDIIFVTQHNSWGQR